MRLLNAVAAAVLVQGILLLTQASGEKSPQDLEKVLEEALKQLRESQKSKGESETGHPAETELGQLTANLTTVLKDLTEAIVNNTKEMLKKSTMEDAGEFGNGAPGEGGDGYQDSIHCEAPFFAVKSECFYVNKYKRVSWSEARNFCKGLGADLAEPVRVNTLRAFLLDKFPEDDYKFFWVGAMEAGTEGNWTWLSSRPLQVSDWATGQPDGGNENCVVLSRDDYPPLHDSPCYTHTTFICERLILHRQ